MSAIGGGSAPLLRGRTEQEAVQPPVQAPVQTGEHQLTEQEVQDATLAQQIH